MWKEPAATARTLFLQDPAEEAGRRTSQHSGAFQIYLCLLLAKYVQSSQSLAVEQIRYCCTRQNSAPPEHNVRLFWVLQGRAKRGQDPNGQKPQMAWDAEFVDDWAEQMR